MESENVYGKPWRDDELDAIIADYFSMLALELAGKPYVKAQHSATLMSKMGRSHRSVEFKHQNISAVLGELGLPWIPGYKPKLNYQSAIFDAIERYLTQHPSGIDLPATKHPELATRLNKIFVDSPPRKIEPLKYPRLQRLIQKFDPAERDSRNRTLGVAGEEFVLEVEHRRLVEADRMDLARKIRWISKDEGDGAGYDIHSFNTAGKEQLLEVKTTNGSARTPFFLSRNECELASERPSEWRIYRVHKFATEPQIFVISPPLEQMLHLTAQSWRANF